MTEAERYQLVRGHFERLVLLGPAERTTALAGIEGEAIRVDVERLLLADADPREVDALNPPPPERIAGFRVVRELGRGGMGVVYEAEEAAPRRRVALKLLHPWLRSPAVDELARREAQALADAPHPGIPSVYALLDHDRGPVVIMELVEGEPFAEALKRRPLPEQLELLARVADAIAYAHVRGVVHRDLKPQNIILAAGDQPKVLDFGLAHTGDASTTTGGGTPAYMAPEQAAGLEPTPRADIYSLGVMTWEALTGVLPGESGGAELRSDLRAVLRRATAADPAYRYANAAELAEELRRAATHRRVAAQPGALAWVRALVRRHPRRAAGAAALLGLLTLAPKAHPTFADVRARSLLRGLQGESPDIHDARTMALLDGLLGDPGLIGSPELVDGWLWKASAAEGEAGRLSALAGAWIYSERPRADVVRRVTVSMRNSGAEEAANALEADGLGKGCLTDWNLRDPALDPPLRGPFAALAQVTALADHFEHPGLDPEGSWRWRSDRLTHPDGRRFSLPASPSDVTSLRTRDGEGLVLASLRFAGAGLYALDGEAARPWAPGALAQMLPVRAIEGADLDGDGADELVVGATGWKGHELRVYNADGSMRARSRLAAWDLAVTRDGTIWVIAGPVPEVAAPHGDRRRLVPLRFEANELVSAGLPLTLDREAMAIWAADLDGDGADELVLRRPDGFAVVAGGVVAWVPGLRVEARVQGDDDAADELRVSNGEVDWLLGVGTGSLPRRTAPALRLAPAPAALRDPRLAAAWSRAAALVELGVVEPVLPHLLDLARASHASAALRAPTLALVMREEQDPPPGLADFATALVGLDPDSPPDEATLAILASSHAFEEGGPLPPPRALRVPRPRLAPPRLAARGPRRHRAARSARWATAPRPRGRGGGRGRGVGAAAGQPPVRGGDGRVRAARLVVRAGPHPWRWPDRGEHDAVANGRRRPERPPPQPVRAR